MNVTSIRVLWRALLAVLIVVAVCAVVAGEALLPGSSSQRVMSLHTLARSGVRPRLKLERRQRDRRGTISVGESHVHDDLLRQAIDLARQARLAGNHPFGALLAIDGLVVLTAQNTVETDRDPTAHAETNLIGKAVRELSPEQVGASVLYASCEPCVMCVGKMFWAGVRSLVFGLSARELATLAGGKFVVPCADLFACAAERVSLTGPLLLDEARRVHEGFWR